MSWNGWTTTPFYTTAPPVLPLAPAPRGSASCGAEDSALRLAFERPLDSSGWRVTLETISASVVRNRQFDKETSMPTTTQYVSNRGPDTPGHPDDVRFVASFETFEEAASLKKKLDAADASRSAIIFQSLVRVTPAARPSHETWHIDTGKESSETASRPDCTPLGFDVFTGPRKL